MKNIFLSYSRPINQIQIEVIDLIKVYLHKKGYLTTEIFNFSKGNPIYYISNKIKNCDYLICIMMEKTTTFTIHKKEIVSSSHWLDIELALAIAHNIPYLIIKDESINESPLVNQYNSLPYIKLYDLRKSPKIKKDYFQDVVIPAVNYFLEENST